MKFFKHYTLKDSLHALLLNYPFCWINISASVAPVVFPKGTQPQILDGWGYISLMDYFEEKAPDVLLMSSRTFPAQQKTQHFSGPKEVARVYVETNGEKGFLFIMSEE